MGPFGVPPSLVQSLAETTTGTLVALATLALVALANFSATTLGGTIIVITTLALALVRTLVLVRILFLVRILVLVRTLSALVIVRTLTLGPLATLFVFGVAFLPISLFLANVIYSCCALGWFTIATSVFIIAGALVSDTKDVGAVFKTGIRFISGVARVAVFPSARGIFFLQFPFAIFALVSLGGATLRFTSAVFVTTFLIIAFACVTFIWLVIWTWAIWHWA